MWGAAPMTWFGSCVPGWETVVMMYRVFLSVFLAPDIPSPLRRWTPKAATRCAIPPTTTTPTTIFAKTLWIVISQRKRKQRELSSTSAGDTKFLAAAPPRPQQDRKISFVELQTENKDFFTSLDQQAGILCKWKTILDLFNSYFSVNEPTLNTDLANFAYSFHHISLHFTKIWCPCSPTAFVLHIFIVDFQDQ